MKTGKHPADTQKSGIVGFAILGFKFRQISMFTIRNFLKCAPVVATLFLLFACSHYQLGPGGGTLAFRTLYIAPVENTAGIPQAGALFSAHLRDAFILDGRVSIVNSPDQADATLTVNLIDYSRNMTTARGDDSGLARKFDLAVTALCTLTDNRTGKPLFEKRPVSTTRQIFTTPTPGAVQSEQLQAEYNTMPLLAASLAESVAHAALDVW